MARGQGSLIEGKIPIFKYDLKSFYLQYLAKLFKTARIGHVKLTRLGVVIGVITTDGCFAGNAHF